MVPFTIKFEDEMHKEVKVLAAKRDVSMQELIQDMIRKGLDEQDA